MSTEWVQQDVPRGTESAVVGCAVAGRAVVGDTTVCGCDDVPNSTIVEVDLQVTGTLVVSSGE